MIKTDQKTLPQTGHGSKTPTIPKRHYVELDAEGKPTDQCLCGHLWDQVFINNHPDAGICQACIDELRRRGHG